VSGKYGIKPVEMLELGSVSVKYGINPVEMLELG
jgi:hypothetical protein